MRIGKAVGLVDFPEMVLVEETGTGYMPRRLALEQVIELSKSLKAGVKGTSINEKDAKDIIDGVQSMYDKIPGIFRSMIPSLPDVLRRIPPSAGKYTLGEIIQLLDWAYENGLLSR